MQAKKVETKAQPQNVEKKPAEAQSEKPSQPAAPIDQEKVDD